MVDLVGPVRVQMLGVAGGIALVGRQPPAARARRSPAAGSASARWRTWFRLPFLAVLPRRGRHHRRPGRVRHHHRRRGPRASGTSPPSASFSRCGASARSSAGSFYGACTGRCRRLLAAGRAGPGDLPARPGATSSALWPGSASSPASSWRRPSPRRSTRRAGSSRRGRGARRWGGTRSFLTAGGAVGAPLAGVAIDARRGGGCGFAVVAVVGLVVARPRASGRRCLAGAAGHARRREPDDRRGSGGPPWRPPSGRVREDGGPPSRLERGCGPGRGPGWHGAPGVSWCQTPTRALRCAPHGDLPCLRVRWDRAPDAARRHTGSFPSARRRAQHAVSRGA